MSTFRRKGRTTYSYDFTIRGHRFSGNTQETEKRAAERVEARIRAEKQSELNAGDPIQGTLTFEAAAARYWQEVAQYQVNNLTALGHIEWLTDQIGRKTLLVDIDNNRVAMLVAARRAMPARAGRNKGKQLSNATVNRTATEPLRKIMLRAANVWEMRIGKVNWRQHMLAEPKERVREASPKEERAYQSKLARGYEVAVEFTQLNGLRRKELVGLTWDQVDFFNRTFTIIGKGNRPRTIPMSTRSHEILWSIKDNHPTAVFTYVAARTDKRKQRYRGKHYPITMGGLKTAWRRCMAATNVKDFRFHDLRHTGATRLLRQTGNLRLAQNLLGHQDIKTTMKYAHVTQDDLRAALDATHSTEISTRESGNSNKALKNNKPGD